VNLANVDLNLLVMLDAVLSTRSATLAASRLHVTQSAVSNGLKRAREQFGDPLVVRQGSGFALTPKAEALAPRLRRVLDEMQSLLAADGERMQRQWVTIACLDAVSMTLVPALLPLLDERLPQTRLRTLTPDHVRFVGLERAEVDLAVGALPHVHTGCEVEDLFEDPMVVIAAANHPKIKSRLSLEAYASLPHAELGLFGEPEDRVDRALAPRGLTRRIEVIVPHLAALPFLVSNSQRIATVTRTIARQFAHPLGLRIHRPPVGLSPLVMRMVWHHRRSSDHTHLALRDVVRAAAHRMAARGIS
jgi:DNA-binding transcriptional LysR family regulator